MSPLAGNRVREVRLPRFFCAAGTTRLFCRALRASPCCLLVLIGAHGLDIHMFDDLVDELVLERFGRGHESIAVGI